jgi:putative peptide zinc metalloprotease protein
VQRLDTSERSDVYLLPVREGAYLRLTAAALGLLRAVETGTTFEELAVIARRSDGRRVSSADVKAAYGMILARIAQTEKDAHKLAGGFWLRMRLIPAAVVEQIAAVCAVAYHPVVAVLLVSLIGIGVGLALMGGVHHVQPISGDFWPGYLLFLGSLLAHEIGHASACVHYRARPSEIGFVLYLVYPAFYSNVSAAWALRRWQRVIVDLGGVYFELVFGAVCAFAYVIGHWEPLRVTLALIAASCQVFAPRSGVIIGAETSLKRTPARGYIPL